MNALEFMHAEPVFIEIGQGSLKALHGHAGLQVPLERMENGRLSLPCRAKLTQALTAFVKRKRWQSAVRAYCAIGARGVSLRRLTLPPSTREELRRVLLLQIESGFPLSPDELAWGYQLLPSHDARAAGSAKQDALVVAARKEVIEEYSELLAACGLTPVFTLAALARSQICPQRPGGCAVLDIGPGQSELITFEDGVATSVRVLAGSLGDEAGLRALTAAINGTRAVQRLFVTGDIANRKETALQLGQRLGAVCEPVEYAGTEGRSAAILGLKKLVELDGGSQLVVLQGKQVNGRSQFTRAEPGKWLRLAAVLAVAALLLPYAEALVMKPFLARKVSAIQAARDRLATIDSEFGFLQYVKANQPPYLEVLYLLSKSVPAGTKVDALSLNRRGELSLRLNMRNPEQVIDFRSKLVDSGFFSAVVIEEQTTTPDRQKVTLRLSAQVKPAESRPLLKDEPPGKEGAKPGAVPGGPPPGTTSGLPPGAMPASSPPPEVMPTPVPSPRPAPQRKE